MKTERTIIVASTVLRGEDLYGVKRSLELSLTATGRTWVRTGFKIGGIQRRCEAVADDNVRFWRHLRFHKDRRLGLVLSVRSLWPLWLSENMQWDVEIQIDTIDAPTGSEPWVADKIKCRNPRRLKAVAMLAQL